MSFAARVRGLFAGPHWKIPAACLLLAAAVSMPSVAVPRDTSSVIVTFDITQSMSVEDVAMDGVPTSRIAFARAAMRDALGQLPCGSKVGWGAFTGQRTMLLLPPVEVCGNYDALLSSLERIDGHMRWTNWSRIAEGGVYSAVRAAQDVGHGAAVLFVTDGQEAPPLLHADTLARDINPGGVKGWLIGVGGDEAVPIPRTDDNGRRMGYWRAEDVIQVPEQDRAATTGPSHEELSALQGHYLESVAGHIGFRYRRLTGADSLRDAMLDARLAHREPVPTDLRWCPALLALLLLIWRFLPPVARSRAKLGAPPGG
ncbi:MxaL protein [Paraburkholderia unamae]|uniref:MxaL protein n=1 Tax=Paraburkholderia unamae TaxID=219649 RepID=A0ABX5KHZ9_9BURK|nr:mxaL protein [Paraburkholderia unamae]CAG9260478.1 Putative MxaL-like protein [Paraburkholderia unamae]